MADLDPAHLQAIQQEVREKKRLVVKLRCNQCQEEVPESLRFETRWYTWLSLAITVLLFGIPGALAAIAGFPLVVTHVHRCSKCGKELLRGNYLEILMKRRKFDTIGLMFPFYAGAFLFGIAIIWNDIWKRDSWEHYKSVCGPLVEPQLAETQFNQYYRAQEVIWTGKVLFRLVFGSFSLDLSGKRD